MTGAKFRMVVLLLLAGYGRAQTTSYFAISGQVLGLEGSAIPKAHLTAASDRPCGASGKTEDAESGAGGRFRLRVPCPGVWRLSGEARGFPMQGYEQHGAFSTGIVLSQAHPEHEVVFRMIASSSVVGTVMDEAGDPVRDAKVYLLRSEAAGGDSLRSLDQTTTDDRGTYEFSDVTPAEYEIAVQVQPWYAVAAQTSRSGGNGSQPNANSGELDPSLDVTYPITYYPAATDAAGASTVDVTGGSKVEADIHLSPVPAVHVIVPGGGRTNLSIGGGRPMTRSGSAPSIQEFSDFGPLKFDPTSVTVLPDGSLDMAGFPPGDFALANGRSRDAAIQNFTIAKDAGRTITLGTGAAGLDQKQETTGTLSGSVALAQQPCQGALLLLVPLATADGRPRRQQSNTDGSFSFEKVPLGRYILIAVDQGWGADLKDPQTVNAYLAHGVPVDFKGTMSLKTAVQAVARQ
jgi:hypothetical protein